MAKPKKDMVEIEIPLADLYTNDNLPKLLLDKLKASLDEVPFTNMGEARKVGEVQARIEELLK